MDGYGPLKAHPFFESITWENLHHQTPPKLTAYLPAMSEDDEDCYGNVSQLTYVGNSTGRDEFCLLCYVKMVPLCKGSLCPQATGLRFVGQMSQREAGIDLVVAEHFAAPQSESLIETRPEKASVCCSSGLSA